MLFHRTHRLLDRVQARFIRSRAGSVLILVIVLLVLLALLGTAFLVTARNDRVSSKLFEQNRQIDLLVDGVKNMAMAVMYNNSQRYDDWYTVGSNGTVDHSWLASRYPCQFSDAEGSPITPPNAPMPLGVMIKSGGQLYLSIKDQNTAPFTDMTSWLSVGPTLGWNSQQPVWPALTGPLATGGYFEDPAYPAHNVNPAGSRTFASPTSLAIGGVNYPALQYWSVANKQMEIALAASASGNGIADSFLWRLPMNTIDGVTYYAAVRIIDNNSAIDANTALSSSFDYDFNGNADNTPGRSPGVFPSGVGLTELLNSYTAAPSILSASPEMNALNVWRFNNTPIQSLGIIGSPSIPTNDQQAGRSDFYFESLGDALTMILGRRSFNPGRAMPSAQAQSLTWGDAAALAYKFDLANPTGPGTLESCLVQSTYNRTATPMAGGSTVSPSFRSTPWSPSQASAPQGWFATNYPDETMPLPAGVVPNRRPYISPHTNLSNMMPTPVLLTGPNAIVNTGLSQAMLSAIGPWMVGNTQYATSTTIPRCSLNTAYATAQDIAPPGTSSVGPTLAYTFYQVMLGALQRPATYDTTTNPPTVQTWPNPINGGQFNIIPLIPGKPYGAFQFRSPIRDLSGVSNLNANPNAALAYYLQGPETIALRALLAACNAKDLRRDPNSIPTVETVAFAPTGAPTVTALRAFGIEKQPFIVEVYANNDTSKSQDQKVGTRQTQNAGFGIANPKGYVAVELYNPYDTPLVMTNWELGVLYRNATPASPTVGKYPAMKMLPITNDAGVPVTITTVMQPHAYLILENYQTTADVRNAIPASMNDAKWLPYMNYGFSPFDPTICYYVPNLNKVMQDAADTTSPGGELYLLRPPAVVTANLNLWDPIDSFDFTGMTIPASTSTTFAAMHYVRSTIGSAVPTPAEMPATWKFVYPGRWDPTGAYAIAPNAQNVNGAFTARQEGIAVSSWNTMNAPPAVNYDYWIDNPPGTTNPVAGAVVSYGAPMSFGSPTLTPTTVTQAPTYGASYANNFNPIQLATTDMPGPHKLNASTSAATNLLPFGGFARVGDVLSVPFIGSYTLLDNAGNIVEMNPVTRDAALADDDDSTLNAGTSDDKIEQIGRFCPIVSAELPSETVVPVLPKTVAQYDRYGFAAHILDYFSAIDNPNDDYLPNIDQNAYIALGRGPWPVPVANTPISTNGGNMGTEDTVPTEGRININTANWRALATVPFVPNNTAANFQIAQSIVQYRNIYGPFKTLFDLNKVPIGGNSAQTFQNYFGDPSALPCDVKWGYLSPTLPNDGVANDYATRFGMINRVSNLLTTRSDTFTVYVLVQGWTGVGTNNPQVALQRRAAFIVDRSQLSATNSTLNVTPVQSN